MIPIRDTIPSRCFPLATLSLIAANVLVFIWHRSLSIAQQELVVYWLGLVPARYTNLLSANPSGWPMFGWWPFLTHMFLHANLPHLIGNMWSLWIFGDNVEDRMGSGRFLIFYLLGGLAAAAAQILMHPSARLPMVGASGAVAAVLGAYFLLFPRSQIIAFAPVLFYPLFFTVPAATYLLFWFLSQWWAGTLSQLMPARTGGIAWWAHIGGFLFGLFLHPLFMISRRRCRRLPEEFFWEEFWR